MIPDNIKNDVEKITKAIMNFNNNSKLSWMQVYKKILKDLHYDKEINNNILLINVVRNITIHGYDIITDPFELKRFK